MKCVFGSCDRKIDAKWCLCGDHYRLLPEELRVPLSRAYNPHLELGDQADGFYAALARVKGWIVKEFGGQAEKPRHCWAQLVASTRERDAARGQPTPAICLVPWKPTELLPAQPRLL